ncbi:MAG: DNA recombination protein RmuC [Candidatus Omnitrophota bacterium]|nr:DNA recombination protein RmuC [Candidatus Omnitrophota bacterium]
MFIWIALAVLAAAFIFLVITLNILFRNLSRELSLLSGQFNLQLKDNLNALLDTHKTVGERIDNVTNVISKVHTSLGELSRTSDMIFGVGKDISSLQQLLRAPKFRGEFAETLLENLLTQVLPRDYFHMQHKFRNGEIADAVVVLGENIVPVDAKFPLENFKRMLEAVVDTEKAQFRKLFVRDVKNRISEVSSKYILPDEKTYDFALMYIPAENVYYETIIKETEIMPYSISKKVIPVSPNTFYAYLQVICLGLKGMQIEKNAKEVMANLSRLNTDIDRFKEDFDLVGVHLTNAKTKYADAQVRLDKFSDKLISSTQVNQNSIAGGENGK